MEWTHLVDADVAARAATPVERRLRIGSIDVGDFGVLQAKVVQVAPAKLFRRRNGSEGLVGRVTLDDGTGEIDLVLWDDENRHARDGTLAPGRAVRLRGATVKAGYRGGVELGLGAAILEPIDADEATSLVGIVGDLPDTRVVGGRFQLELPLRVEGRDVVVVLWDDAVKAARDGASGRLRIDGVVPHPVLDDWFLGDGSTVSPLPQP